MEQCDVLIVGGGPAGSSCARRLGRLGLDVLIMDRLAFPRDKVCAGWITPQVIDDVELDCDDYRRGRTFQPVVGFRTGVIGSRETVDTRYKRPVSYGIRRCEFDQYLLERSGSRVRFAEPAATFRRVGAGWIVNESIETRMLVGAGGHFCPVARWLNPRVDPLPLVVAQEAEFPIDPADTDTQSWPAAPGVPELYFRRDLSGYGWCFRKERYMNVGFGLLGPGLLPKATAAFVEFLRAERQIPSSPSLRWRGHAYLVSQAPRRRAVGDAVILIGDAAGVASAQSGEGIRPAIESGLIAAATIAEAAGRYSHDRLASYEPRLRARFGNQDSRRALARTIVPAVATRLLPWLLNQRWFTRRFVLDRWFLNRHQPALSSS